MLVQTQRLLLDRMRHMMLDSAPSVANREGRMDFSARTTVNSPRTVTDSWQTGWKLRFVRVGRALHSQMQSVALPKSSDLRHSRKPTG